MAGETARLVSTPRVGRAVIAPPDLDRLLVQGEINTNDGGRGAYFEDPSGHLIEIITRAYGSG